MRARFVPVALVLALLGQLSSLAHLWVVEHEVCKEHGQLIDEDGEHCIVGLTPGEPFEAPRLEPRDALVMVPLEAPATAPVVARSRTVLRFAPKTSPPTA